MRPSLSLSGKRMPSLPCGVWLSAPLGLACPSFCYQQVVCSNGSYIIHSSPPHNYYTSLKTSTHVGILVARLDIFTHSHDLQPLFLLFFLTSRQVSWPRTLMSGTVRCTLIFIYLLSFIHIFFQEINGVTLLICVINSTVFSKLIQNSLYIKRSCSKFIIDLK